MRCTSCRKSIPDSSEACPHCSASQYAQTPEQVQEEPTIFDGRTINFMPGNRFAGRYRIVDRAGDGGMGIVYKAIDETLGKDVALKVIRPELAGRPEQVNRFKREVRLMQEITHPNVCRVHDIGGHEGHLYLSMQWVSGDTLRSLIRRASTLTEERAIEISLGILRALEAAQTQGVVHRDLKPGNVMIDGSGAIVVMDFGLATERDSEQSAPGAGTYAYMAPEQRLGKRVDGRADLYSLGVVLHEMLTGKRPEDVGFDFAVLRQRSSARNAAFCERLLQQEPENRFATAEEAREYLEGSRTEMAAPGTATSAPYSDSATQTSAASRPLLAGAAAVLVLIAVLFALPPSRSWIFNTVGGTPEAPGYYERGVYYLREEFENVEGLDNAITMFRRAIAEDSTSAAAWAGMSEAYWIRFNRTKQATSRDQAEAAEQSALALDDELSETHVAIARGQYTLGEYELAEQSARSAIALDDENDMAWELLGRAHQGQSEYAEGLAAIQKAIEIRPNSYQHWMVLGRFYGVFGEHDSAIEAYQGALEFKPDSRIAWNNIGAMHIQRGRYREAIGALESGLAIEDRASTRTNLGTCHFYLGEFEAAIPHYERATELAPKIGVFWGNLGDAHLAMGDLDASRAAYLRAVELAEAEVQASPDRADAHATLARWLAKAREFDRAKHEARVAVQLAESDAETNYYASLVFCLAREIDASLDYMERAISLGIGRARIADDPDFENVRDHPRYIELMELAS